MESGHLSPACDWRAGRLATPLMALTGMQSLSHWWELFCFVDTPSAKKWGEDEDLEHIEHRKIPYCPYIAFCLETCLSIVGLLLDRLVLPQQRLYRLRGILRLPSSHFSQLRLFNTVGVANLQLKVRRITCRRVFLLHFLLPNRSHKMVVLTSSPDAVQPSSFRLCSSQNAVEAG